VDGVVSVDDLCQWHERTIANYNVSALLLGYKEQGRATSTGAPYRGAWQQVYEADAWDLRVDSLFAKQYATALTNYEGVSVETREGFYSCYIDGPKWLLASSSYQMEYAIKLTNHTDWDKLAVV
jgi:hypothetical protein